MGMASYSTTPSSNTSISGINIGEGCAPSGINDAIRQLMADIATDVPNKNAASNYGAAQNFAKGTDIASASITDIGAASGNFINITGTTNITGLGTIQAGTFRFVRFTGTPLLKSSSAMIMPGSADIQTVANDCSLWMSLGSGNWQCLNYSPISSVPGSGVVTAGVANQLAFYASSGAAVSGTNALPSGTTASTPTLSGQVANKSYVDGLVSSTGITLQQFTTGSGTYTTPANVKWIKIRMVGAGGGGGATGGSGGGTGGNTTFSGFTASGGVGGGGGATGTGGGGAGGGISGLGATSFGFAGAKGGGGPNTDPGTTTVIGGIGGASTFAGGGAGGISGAAGTAAATNSGAGGGGGGLNSGVANSAGGGGAGGYIEAIINTPASTYSYGVGTAGTAGSGGIGGGVGGAGFIVVEEHYSY